MTDEEAQAIAARVEAATPGPWHITPAGEIVSVVARRMVADALMSGYALGPDAENADFIAHAREDIPTLLAERTALLEIVQAVADGRVIFGHVVTMDGIDAPNYVHWMTQARALLGMSREDSQP